MGGQENPLIPSRRVLRYARLRRATQDEGDFLVSQTPLILSSGAAAYRRTATPAPAQPHAASAAAPVPAMRPDTKHSAMLPPDM